MTHARQPQTPGCLVLALSFLLALWPAHTKAQPPQTPTPKSSSKTDRTEKRDKADKTDSSDKTDKTESSDRTDRLASSDKSSSPTRTSKRQATHKGKQKAKLGKEKARPANRLEWGLLPIFAGDTDIGLGVGLLGVLTRFKRGYTPHQWWLEFMLYSTFKQGPEGIEFPYHNYRVQLDLPGLVGGKLRLFLRADFLRFSNAGYYGLGNASTSPRIWESLDPASDLYARSRRRYQYTRTAPYARAFVRYTLLDKLFLFAGATFTYNWIDLYPGSKLAEDLAQSGVTEPFLVLGTRPHGSLQCNIGLVWDTRDNELAPQRGMFHDISLRGAPGLWQRLSFAGANVTLRFFASPIPQFLTIALRLMGDVLLGNVPFYELARYGGFFPEQGLGGSYGIPGIPFGRYHGKFKVIGNLELRSRWWELRLFGVPLNLGTVFFVGTGRVWLDTEARPDLDGTNAGLKWGVGGGVRLQWGQAFVLRGDLAWSPDAAALTPGFPFGIYLYVGQVF